ncbi:unnamed protein product, partial [Rotaria magnacalcarata]
MSIHSVRLLINSFIKRPCTHFRSFTNSSCLFNKSTARYQYQRELTKREANLHKQFIQRYMAAPMNDENVEKLLEPFRAAVKVQGDIVKQMKD